MCCTILKKSSLIPRRWKLDTARSCAPRVNGKRLPPLALFTCAYAVVKDRLEIKVSLVELLAGLGRPSRRCPSEVELIGIEPSVAARPAKWS